MTEMLAKELQTGLNFLMWPDLVAKGVFKAQSLSEFILEVVRLKPENKQVTADHVLFRKVRDSSLTVEETTHFFERYHFDTVAEIKHVTEIGAWPIIKLLLDREINSIKGSELSPEQKATTLQVLHFFIALCDVDRDFINQCRSFAPNVNYELLNVSFREWLLVDCDFKNMDTLQGAELIIAAVLQMAALFSLYLRQTLPDEQGQLSYKSIVPGILPIMTIIKGRPTFLNSNHRLIEMFKAAWEKSEFRYGNKTTWHAFYQDLVRAEHLTSEWYLNDKRKLPTELLAPDVGKIKKRIARIKDGYLVGSSIKPHQLTMSEIRWFIKAISPQSAEQIDQSMLELHIVSIMELVQFELLNKGIAPEKICELFARYPLHQQALERRFREFCTTGSVQVNF